MGGRRTCPAVPALEEALTSSGVGYGRHLKATSKIGRELGYHSPWPKCKTLEEAIAAEVASDAELAAEYPDDPTDEEEGWSPPIAEMIEIEVNLPQSVQR